MLRSRPLLLVLVVMLFGLAACVQVPVPAATSGETTGEATPMAEATPSGEVASPLVSVSENEELGQFLVAANGMTLYLFTNDTPGVTNCYDRCAENWPPLLLEEGQELAGGDGIDASLLGTTERTDGTTQVTYNGWPLYYWVRDTQPGDTTGQDVGDVWYVISPAGEMVESPESGIVLVSENEELGQFLVGPNGMTLYLFLNDTPGVTNCYDRCAENWPPLLLEEGAELAGGDGIDAALLGTTERTDGTTQVTYNGWPLYYWAQDTAVGDTTGQGVGDVWYVISPAGEQIGGM